MKPVHPSAATYSGRNLHGQVVHELGRRIVGGDYAPGQVLPNEEELCVQLSVSRTALREAVKVLAAKGLIESRPRVGNRVRARESWNMLDPDVLAWRCATGPDTPFLMHLTEMREIFEPAAAALAARNRSAEQLGAIEAAYGAMCEAQAIADWVRADLDFHSAVLAATNNPLLVPLSAMIGSALETLLGITARSARDFRMALPDHGKVLEAIRAMDEQTALHRMAGLLSDTRAIMLQASMDTGADALPEPLPAVQTTAR